MRVDDKSLFREFEGGWWTRSWNVPSPANKGTRKVQVFLPPDYFTSTRRYPVIYFYHGITGFSSSFSTVRRGLIPAVAKGVADPVIYVAPDLVKETMCADAKNGVIMSETFAVKELIPYIDSNFRTLAVRGQRALEGNSMGGFCSLLYLVKYPTLFGSVTPYCPALHDAERFNSGFDNGYNLGELVGKKMYNNDLSYARKYNPWDTWNQNLEEVKKVPILTMTGERDGAFARRGKEFTDLLVNAGVDAQFVLVKEARHGVSSILEHLPDPQIGYVFHTKNFRRNAGAERADGGVAASDAGSIRDAGADATSTGTRLDAGTQPQPEDRENQKDAGNAPSTGAPDAGSPPRDPAPGRRPDAGTTPGADSTPPSQPADDPEGEPPAPSGGCSIAPESTSPWLMLLVVAYGWVSRRRARLASPAAPHPRIPNRNS